jgi:DNA-binding transcriptional LysR family regulator
VNNVGTMLGACAAGHGVAPILALGTEDLLSRGKLIELFPDWSDERFPLYAFHLSARKGACVPGFRSGLGSLTTLFPRTKPGHFR